MVPAKLFHCPSIIKPPTAQSQMNICPEMLLEHKTPVIHLQLKNAKCISVFICLGFTFEQCLRSYQNRHLLVTVCAHDNSYSAAPLGDQAIGIMTSITL